MSIKTKQKYTLQARIKNAFIDYYTDYIEHYGDFEVESIDVKIDENEQEATIDFRYTIEHNEDMPDEDYIKLLLMKVITAKQ